MYIINNNGPKMDPCVTSVLIFKVSDFALLYSTYCLRLVKSF